MRQQTSLLTAHCTFIHDLNAAWLELWSAPNTAKNLKPSV
jgi:hypothetical protein